MMKKMWMFAMVSVAALCFACQKSEPVEAQDELETIQFTISPNVTTKSVQAPEALKKVTGYGLRYVVEVWTKEQTPTRFSRQEVAASVSGDYYASASVTLTLPKGNDYQVYAWADWAVMASSGLTATEVAADCFYTTNKGVGTGLTAVVKKTAQVQVQETSYHVQDAYYGAADLSTIKTEGTMSLTRATAEIRLSISDWINSTLADPQHCTVTTSSLSTFDVSTGAASVSATGNAIVRYTLPTKVASGSLVVHVLNTFAPAAESTLTSYAIAFTGFTESSPTPTTLYDKTLTNIPIRQNYRTNISGNLFSETTTFAISVDPTFTNGIDNGL